MSRRVEDDFENERVYEGKKSLLEGVQNETSTFAS